MFCLVELCANNAFYLLKENQHDIGKITEWFILHFENLTITNFKSEMLIISLGEQSKLEMSHIVEKVHNFLDSLPRIIWTILNLGKN